MLLQIEQKELKPDVLLVMLTGRVMLGPESAQIESLVAESLDQGRRKFIFDLSGVSHIDSTGIGRFISSFNKVMQAGGKLHMAAAGGTVRDGFRVTRLDTVFKFFPDVEAALAAMG
jgi:anti-sigma B factor antagonist